MSVEAVQAVIAATEDLTRVEKLVLLAFAWRSGADGYDAWTGAPGSVECAEWAMVTEDHAGRTVRLLRDRGLLELVEEGRRGRKARYRLVEGELRSRYPSQPTGESSAVTPVSPLGLEPPLPQSADSDTPVSPPVGKRKKEKKLSMSVSHPGDRLLPRPSSPAREESDAAQTGDGHSPDEELEKTVAREETEGLERAIEEPEFKEQEDVVLDILTRLSATFEPGGYDLEERRSYWAARIPDGQGKLLDAMFKRVALNGRGWGSIEDALAAAEAADWPAEITRTPKALAAVEV